MSNAATRDQLKVSTRVLYDGLVRRQSQVTIIDAGASLLEYTDVNHKTHLLFSTCSDKSAATGVSIAGSKAKSAIIASRMGIRIPQQVTCRDIREVRKFLDAHKRIVIKPVSGSGGKGISTNITTEKHLERAYAYAKTISSVVVAQQHITGDDVRLLIVAGSFCSAIIRKPAHIIGDGLSTIEELIHMANRDLSRNDDDNSSLMHINMSAAWRYLGETITSTPADGQEVRVAGPANVSLGGSLHEASHLVTPTIISDAEAFTKKLGLGICGIDMMWDRAANRHYFIEANAKPGIDIHDDPFSGTRSDCVERYVDWLVA